MKKIMGTVIVIYIIVITLMESVIADSISLGSISDINSMTLKPGEQGVFRAYFFNMGNNPISVDIDAEYPSDLRVEIHPKELRIEKETTENPSANDTYLILADGKTYAKLHRVNVYIKIPSRISTNLYKVKLIARAVSSEMEEREGITQSLIQVREIPLTIYVPGVVSGRTRERNEEIILEHPIILERGENDTFFIKPGSGVGVSEHGKREGKREITTTLQAHDEKHRAEEEKEKKSTGILGVKKAKDGRIMVNLPTGQIIINKEQQETAIDLGLITLIISIASLILRILK